MLDLIVRINLQALNTSSGSFPFLCFYKVLAYEKCYTQYSNSIFLYFINNTNNLSIKTEHLAESAHKLDISVAWS